MKKQFYKKMIYTGAVVGGILKAGLGIEVYAAGYDYRLSQVESLPLLETDFSFMEAEDAVEETGGIDESIWSSYNANFRTCSSSATSSSNSKNYPVIVSTVSSGKQTAPYIISFSNNCSKAAEWQRTVNVNDFFREQYGEMVSYSTASLQYNNTGKDSMSYIYKNFKGEINGKSYNNTDNFFNSGYTYWGVKLNTATCGYGKVSKTINYVSGCSNSYGQNSSNGRLSKGSSTKVEWQNLGYSGQGYELVNSHFPPDYPLNSGTVKAYKFDANFNRKTTAATTYDDGTDATKSAIKKDAIVALIAQEGVTNDIDAWSKRLSLKNNASTEAGNFVGTQTVKQGSFYTIVVTKAPQAARYNIALVNTELIDNGSVIGSYWRNPMQETGTQTNPSKSLHANKSYTLRFTLKNDSTYALAATYNVDYTINGQKFTASEWKNIGAGGTATITVNFTAPNETKTFDIVSQVHSNENNQWNADDKSTIRVSTYKDNLAPDMHNSSVSGCSASSATISVSSTDNPRDSYASGYSHTILTKPGGGTETNWGNPATFTVYSDGTYYLKSCDKNGNCSGNMTINVNSIDKQAPTASVSGIPNKWVNTNVTATVSGTDPYHNCSGISKAWWRINNGAWQYRDATTASVTLTDTGAHKFEYAVTDRVGTHSPTLSTTVYIDKERPTINAVTPVGATSSSGILLVGGSATSVTYDLNVTENHSGLSSYSYAWNNNPWGSEIRWSGNRLTIPINGAAPNQLNSMWIRVMDAAGNWRTTTPTVLYDTTGPTINQSQIVITPYYNNKTTANVKVTAKDNFQDAGYTYVKYIYLSNDNYNWTKYTATNNSINVTWNTRTPDAVYTLYAKAEDSLGNVGAVQTQTYVTDQTKPTGSITIGDGQNHFPNESVRLNFTYGDNLSGVSKIEIYDINNGTASNSVYTINNPTSQKTVDWVLKPYTVSDGSIRAQVGMKITDKAGNTTTVKSKEIYISRVTIKDFHLTNVVNPTVYNKTNPFKRMTHPNISEQQLLAGGSFSFESNYIYPLGAVHNSWRVTHIATIQYHYPNGTIRNIEMTDSKVTFSGKFSKLHEIPFDIPVGTKVYIKINVKLHDSSGGVFTQDYYPKPNGSLIYLGKIQDDIRNVINFNEIK